MLHKFSPRSNVSKVFFFFLQSFQELLVKYLHPTIIFTNSLANRSNSTISPSTPKISGKPFKFYKALCNFNI